MREHGKMAKASGHIKRFAFNVAQAISPNALTSLITGRDRSFMFNAIGARAVLPGRFLRQAVLSRLPILSTGKP